MLCQIAEQSGHGIPTIIRKYGKQAFNFRGSAIKVAIKYAFNLVDVKANVVEKDKNVVEKNKNVVEKGKNVVEKDKDVVEKDKDVVETDIIELVFNEIKNNIYISANEIANILNKNPRTIQRVIATLKETNRIKRVGPDKGGHWGIINE